MTTPLAIFAPKRFSIFLLKPIIGNKPELNMISPTYNQSNLLEKNIALYEENKKLYEQLLESERKRCVLLEEMMRK
jgi:hypothetical protein